MSYHDVGADQPPAQRPAPAPAPSRSTGAKEGSTKSTSKTSQGRQAALREKAAADQEAADEASKAAADGGFPIVKGVVVVIGTFLGWRWWKNRKKRSAA